MSNLDYFFFGFIILWGLLKIILNKPLLAGMERYTEESVKRYSRPSGIVTVVMGASGMLFLYTVHEFFAERMSGVIVLFTFALFAAGIVASVLIRKKILVKRSYK